MAFCADLSADDPTIGGKARSLARLRDEGLPVPPAFAITGALFEEMRIGTAAPSLRQPTDLDALEAAARALDDAPWPAGFAAELAARLGALGGDRFAVRSSFAGEDDPAALAPGVYESRTDVSARQVPDAIRAVLRSALAPGAVAYAQSHGGPAMHVAGTQAPRDPALHAARTPAPGEAASHPARAPAHGGPAPHAGRDQTPGEASLHAARTPAPGEAASHAARAAQAQARGALAPSGAEEPSLAGPASAPVAAVLVHPFVSGEAAGAAALDPVRPPIVVDMRHGEPSSGARAVLVDALARLVARHGGTEVEWVSAGDSVTFLQMRPWRAPAPVARWPHADELEPDALPWRWDAEHNPLPLSPAQQGLVALVDARCRTGLRQKIAGGYLFVAPGGERPTRVIAPAQARTFFTELAADAQRRLDALGDPPPLEPALDTLCAVYEPLYGVLAPGLRRGRDALASFLRANLPSALPQMPALLSGVTSAAAERRRLAARLAKARSTPEGDAARRAYVDAFGDEAPAWDVATPTWRETPEAGAPSPAPPSTRPPAEPADDEWRMAARAVLDRLPRMARGAWKDLLPVARDAVALGEDDDLLYARVQGAVRRALREIGRRLVDAGRLDSPDDVFWAPLDRVRAFARGDDDGGGLREAVIDARAVDRTTRLGAPPLSSPGQPLAAGVVRGLPGSPGRVVGTVAASAHAGAASVAASGDGGGPGPRVLVAATLLPAELPLVSAAAVVVETGGPLGHVAAQCRERGIPAVVGAAGAEERLRPGDLVFVDGGAGLVLKLPSRG